MIKKKYSIESGEIERLISIDVIDDKDLIIEHQDFDEYGECIYRITSEYSDDFLPEKVTIYDENNSIIQKTEYFSYVDSTEKVVREKISYLNNTNDENISYYTDGLIRKRDSFENGALIKTELYDYDDTSRILEYRELGNENNELVTKYYEYGFNFSIIKIYREKELEETRYLEYGLNDLLMREIVDDGFYKITTEYQYDECNNLISEKQYQGTIQVYNEIKKYDDNNNCIYIESEKLNSYRTTQVDRYQSVFEYDNENRMIYSCDYSGACRYTYE